MLNTNASEKFTKEGLTFDVLILREKHPIIPKTVHFLQIRKITPVIKINLKPAFSCQSPA